MDGLPDGWDLDRVRATGMYRAHLLPPDMSVFIEVHNSDGSEEYLPLVATCILVERVEGEKDGYCLVRNAEDGEWYMGVRVGEDAIVCWASYGASLEDAIDAL